MRGKLSRFFNSTLSSYIALRRSFVSYNDCDVKPCSFYIDKNGFLQGYFCGWLYI